MSTSIELDVDFIRAQFPAFTEPSLEGWAFMENAGGSFTCRQTIDRLTRFYRETKVQPYGPYPASARAGNEMDEAYARLAAVLNVGSEEVHIGPSTSQNTYTLAQAFRSGWTEGDNIVVTNQDHEANSGVWRRLAESGIEVREWRADPETGSLDPADLPDLLSERTRLVAFPHCSNIVAEINPVKEICAQIKAAGAVSVVDGVSAAPHGLPDVGQLGADVYLFSAYKTYGPHQGIMTVRKSVLEQLSNQSHFFNDTSLRKRLIPAGPDHGQVAACNGIIDYIELVDAHHFGAETGAIATGGRIRDLFRAAETELLTPLIDWLANRSDVRLLGPIEAERRVPTVAFVPSSDPAQVSAKLSEQKVMAGSGHFYAVRLLESVNVSPASGAVRLSFVHYTSSGEIEQTLNALEQVL